jgi:hypothetical protein
MTSQPDWVQAALDREMAHDPGTVFCYDSPGMHLLSAILQEATGMTALDYARQNLFGPLGIQEVIWDSDPQGYSQGWGDLHLKPHEAAKIGYLFLHGGMWEGKQIVPADWVAEAVKPLTKTGDDDDYGYGWWATEEAFNAMGRGGQRIVVVPSLNAIVVTTGSGFEYDDVGQYLVAALVDTEKPLPPNPEGVAQLQAALAEAVRAPEPQPAGPLPDIAQAISDKTYVFEPNPGDVETVRFVFNDPAEATAYITRRISKKQGTWPIGLDGVYRLLPDGSARRGGWVNPQTFAFEVVDVDTRTYRVSFEGEGVVIESPEVGIRVEGKQENP